MIFANLTARERSESLVGDPVEGLDDFKDFIRSHENTFGDVLWGGGGGKEGGFRGGARGGGGAALRVTGGQAGAATSNGCLQHGG